MRFDVDYLFINWFGAEYINAHGVITSCVQQKDFCNPVCSLNPLNQDVIMQVLLPHSLSVKGLAVFSEQPVSG